MGSTGVIGGIDRLRDSLDILTSKKLQSLELATLPFPFFYKRINLSMTE